MVKNVEKNEKKIRIKDEGVKTLFSQLESLCEGLIYVSETDAPVTAFVSETDSLVGGNILQQITGKMVDRIDEVSFANFFERLTIVKDWYGDREKTQAKKFLDLQKLIEENLSDLKVFRIGEIRIQIFAGGFDSRGRLMGISTNAVET